MSPAWLTALAALLTVVVGVAGWLLRQAWRIGTRWMRFLDDFFGEAPRDGMPGRPGVMSRITAMETGMAEVNQKVDRIYAETQSNGGGSLRDAVNGVASDLSAHRNDIGELRRRMELFEQQRAKREE